MHQLLRTVNVAMTVNESARVHTPYAFQMPEPPRNDSMQLHAHTADDPPAQMPLPCKKNGR